MADQDASSGSAHDFYGDFGDDLPFQPLSRSTMTRSRTDYREAETLEDLQGPVFRSVAIEPQDMGAEEYAHPPTLPDLFSSKSMPAFADYREFGSATKSFPSEMPSGVQKSMGFDDSDYGGSVFRSSAEGLSPFEIEPPHKRAELEMPSPFDSFVSPFPQSPKQEGFGADSPFDYTEKVVDTEHRPSERENAMLAEFSRSADELDALFNESVSSGRILDLSQREVEGIPVAPSYFEVNTSFISTCELPTIMEALVVGLKACKADYERNDAAAKISGTAYYNLEAADFEIHLYKNRKADNLVVEFQRRYGDVMVFAEFYRDMMWWLRRPDGELPAGITNIVARAADPNGALPPNVRDDGFGPMRQLSKEPGGIGVTGVKGIYAMLKSDFIECKREAAVLIARACRSDKDTIAKMAETPAQLKELLDTGDKELCRCAVGALSVSVRPTR
jgi:hypothetical protein